MLVWWHVKARNSKIPNLPVDESGEYNLSIQNSVLCVFPVMSVSRFLKILSTIQNGTSLSFEFVQTRFPFRITSHLYLHLFEALDS
jgi:hypothetical protein